MEETVYPRHCIVTCDGPCIEGLYHYGFIISLVASVLTCMVALYNVGMHFLNFNNPYFQSKIISTSAHMQSFSLSPLLTALPPPSPSSL